jgi:hypothetical protein
MASQTTRPWAQALALCLSALALAAIPAERAHACGVTPCVPGEPLPKNGTLPANAQSLLWKKSQRSGAAAPAETLHLYTLQGSTRVELPFTSTADGELLRLTPNTPLAAGSELLLDVDVDVYCQPTPNKPAMRVRVTATAPKPTQLGMLQAEAHVSSGLRVGDQIGACSRIPDEYVPLRLTPSEQALPYVDGLRHALIVDGVEQPQFPPRKGEQLPSLGGPLTDWLIVHCNDNTPGMKMHEPGSHRVQWLSRLIDGSELRSDEIQVALHCPSDAGVGQDAAAAQTTAPTPSSGSEADADMNTSDAAAPDAADAGHAAAQEPSTPNQAGDTISQPDTDDAGCSVAAHQHWQSALGWALTLLAAWIAQARLRPRRDLR